MTFIPLTEVVKFMERVKGAKTLRRCPVCLGTGEFDTMNNMGPDVPKCWVCKGTGFVDLASVCVCGNAAVLFQDNMIYCGRDLCLTSLKHGRTRGFSC